MKMQIYYTAREGRRNNYGHTTTRGNVYVVDLVYEDGGSQHRLINIGEYVHQSGGAGIERAILDVAREHGIGTNGGYFGNWHDAIEVIEL